MISSEEQMLDVSYLCDIIYFNTVMMLQALEEMLRTMLNLIPSLLVVTTSRPCIGFIDLPHEELKVDTLCSEDAEKLLTITAPELSKTSAAMLARHCGNIPYALRIVGCTVEQRALTAQVPICS